MTEAEWLAATDPAPMLAYVRGRARERRLRLFATACCRRIAHVVPDEEIRRIVDVSDEYADGANDSLRKECFGAESFESHGNRASTVLESIALGALRCLGEVMDVFQAFQDAAAAMGHIELGKKKLIDEEQSRSINPQGATVKMVVIRRGWKQEYIEQSRLLRDIFGNPFRPVIFDPAWRTSTAIALAQGMYESRDFSAMPILADALQDAGCENEDVLNHCREANGVHVRGCWVVDLVLGKA